MSTTYKKIGGIKTRVNIEGEGTPILILHGWGSSLVSWKKVQKELVNDGYKVYCPDLPGFGKSEKLSEAWNLDDYCKWVIDFCKFYNLNDLIIIGHSFGGRLTIKINQAGFKERIKKNILVAPAGIKVELNIKQ